VRIGEGAAGDVNAQHVGGDPRHDLRREPERAGVESRVAGRRRAQWVELRRLVPEIPDGLYERHGGGDVLQVIAGGSREQGAGSSSCRRMNSSLLSALCYLAQDFKQRIVEVLFD